MCLWTVPGGQHLMTDQNAIGCHGASLSFGCVVDGQCLHFWGRGDLSNHSLDWENQSHSQPLQSMDWFILVYIGLYKGTLAGSHVFSHETWKLQLMFPPFFGHRSSRGCPRMWRSQEETTDFPFAKRQRSEDFAFNPQFPTNIYIYIIIYI